MEVDIYIKEAEGSREIRIPWLPDKVVFTSNGTRMMEYDILDVGEVNIPTGSNLGNFSWSSTFPGEGHKNLPFLRGTWQDPKKIQTILSEWREYGTPLKLLMTGTPINHDVYLTDYSVAYESGYGDYKYDIEFKRRRKIKIISTKIESPKPSTTTTTTEKSDSNYEAYKIQTGDTLWGLARKKLGNGTRWPEIYNLNKTVLDDEAKRRGMSPGSRWIFTGTVIKIPTSS